MERRINTFVIITITDTDNSPDVAEFPYHTLTVNLTITTTIDDTNTLTVAFTNNFHPFTTPPAVLN